MKIRKAPDDLLNTGLTNRYVSENGLIEIGTYRVLYGWRVRAGFVGSKCCEINWCFAGDMKQLAHYFVNLIFVLETRPEDRDCFEGIPIISVTKPCFSDEAFVKSMRDLISSVAHEAFANALSEAFKGETNVVA